MLQRLWVMGVSSLLAAACSKDTRTAPPLPPCTSTGSGQVSQAYAAYGAIDPTVTSGCAVFQPNATVSQMQYLVVPQSASGVPDDSSSFLLRGAVFGAAPPARPAAALLQLPAQQQFDLTLRRAERDLAIRLGPQARPQLAPPVTAAPPVEGTSRTFKVCGDLNCSTHPTVTATARKVRLGGHVAIYIDSADSLSGDTLSTFDLDTLSAVFDTLLYPADTAAFGHETDIDANGVVLVLMTGKVNSLVTSAQCLSSGFVAGYFFGGDLLPPSQFNPGTNQAEIFYSLVPDPGGTLSCSHTATGVKRTVPGTFIHEFQHMISFGQHVLLRRGNPEDLWLNEGLSHYAEELGSRLFTPGDSTTYCFFIFGDLNNSAKYFANPQTYFLVDTAGIGGLANRGAYWLFVRFLVDQVSSDTSRAANNVVTRQLDATNLTGAMNVANVTGAPFATIVEHWALANYVSDLPGFTPPPELQYKRWQFRTDYPKVHNACLARTGSGSFPNAYLLVPTTGAGSATNLSGTLRGGSGTYYIAQQASSAPGFTLLFSDAAGAALPPAVVPRLNVIRIQ